MLLLSVPGGVTGPYASLSNIVTTAKITQVAPIAPYVSNDNLFTSMNYLIYTNILFLFTTR